VFLLRLPSASTENEDRSQNDSSAQTNATNVSADTGTSQDASPSLLVVSTVIPALESSAEPSNSNPSPPATTCDTAGHENAANVVQASRTSEDSTPAKTSRKPAAKKAQKPKKMIDSK